MAARSGRPPKILIVGAGIFGTSTAYHLSQALLPEHVSSVTLIDRFPFPPPSADAPFSPGQPSPANGNSTPPASTNSPRSPTTSPPPDAQGPPSASHDINKIVRADYTDPFYMKLGYEAIRAWSTWPLLQPYYHRSGWVHLDEVGSSNATRIRKNFKDSGELDETSDLNLDEVKTGWQGVFSELDMRGFDSAYWNPGAGWAEADKAVTAMMRDAVEKGVRYVQGDVTELVLRDDATGVRGVRLADSAILEADQVVLATGAWTSKLMDSTEEALNIADEARMEKQVMAAGVCCIHFELDAMEMSKWARSPVMVYGENGEMLPPPTSNNLLKITNATNFTNKIKTISGRTISVPPAGSQMQVPEKIKDETLAYSRRLVPSIASSRPIAFLRLCWDSISPSQHQLITRHPDPRLSNLVIAAAGSFHSWKFLPIIGKYVISVIEGRSNGEEKDRNWGWKASGWGMLGTEEMQKHVRQKWIPKRNMNDLL